MQHLHTVLKWLAAVGGAALGWFGGWSPLLTALCVFMGIEYYRYPVYQPVMQTAIEVVTVLLPLVAPLLPQMRKKSLLVWSQCVVLVVGGWFFYIQQLGIEFLCLLVFPITGQRPCQHTVYIVIIRRLIVQTEKNLLCLFILTEIRLTNSLIQ